MTAELTAKLQQLADLANEIGAEGVWLLRGTKDAHLIYTPADSVVVNGTTIKVNMTIRFDIADTGIIVLMRFPSDGGEPGVESK
ncbi:MAG: hypothetical protein BroJett011_62060 [Chloroflexota bacterium]|nr:MAG: hypothetical protein BroJett011_62060 [Chloroflexota bacterium]